MLLMACDLCHNCILLIAFKSYYHSCIYNPNTARFLFIMVFTRSLGVFITNKHFSSNIVTLMPSYSLYFLLFLILF